MKYNLVDDEMINKQLCKNTFINKRIYSKADYKKFPSLKSVLKPRMIYIIKDAREQDNKESDYVPNVTSSARIIQQ